MTARPSSPVLSRLAGALVVAGLALSLAPAQAQTVRLPKTQYAVGEAILVQVTNSWTDSDWVTVVPVGAPADTYGEWEYLSGIEAGTVRFAGLPAGRYEVRAYCCWAPGRPGHGGYRIVSRVAFTVR